MPAKPAARFAGHYPYRAAIDAYGNGGFRFADMSHRGSILILASGVYAWDVADAAQLTPEHFARVVAEKDRIGFLMLGTGPKQVFPSAPVRKLFADAGLGLETMSTGAAARTFNILLGEGRPVAAALVAVD
jgi:uncharacterized protein